MTDETVQMESSLLSKILAKIGIAILAVALFDLVYLNYLTFKNDGVKQGARTVDIKPTPAPAASPQPVASGQPSPSSQVSSTPVTTSTQQTIVQTAQKEIFIPVGDGSTSSNSYTNLSGAQVAVDSSNYSGIASADFEASVWVTGGNGRAYAQLYNVTAGHPVWNSEITTSSASGVLLVSGPITLDGGQNTYQIQAKTNLTEFPTNVRTGRIKIVLK